MKKHWIVTNNPLFALNAGALAETSGIVLEYDPTPGAIEEAARTGKATVFGINVPAMLMLSLVKDGDKVAARVAQQLNTYPALLGALKRVESLMTELGAKGEPLKTVRAAIAAAEAEPEALS